MEVLRLKNKYSMRIPNNVTTLYCKKTNVLTLIGPLKKKSLNLNVKLFFLHPNILVITSSPIKNTSNIGMEKSKYMQGTTIAKIKHALVEINFKLYKKLILIGVGYRVFKLESAENQIFFKLGFSHLVYFKIPIQFGTFSIKFTKLFIFGNSSYESITLLTSLIRKCKTPEPYKGKGILYYGEKIKLKKGKKI